MIKPASYKPYRGLGCWQLRGSVSTAYGDRRCAASAQEKRQAFQQ